MTSPAGNPREARLTIVARFIVPGGTEEVTVEIPLPAANAEVACHHERYLTSIELRANDEPIIRAPLSFHWDSRMLHTVCRRAGDPMIDRIEW